MATINSEDLKKIEQITKKGENKARVITRALALRLRHLNYSAIEIANILSITPKTVYNIEDNYERGGLEKALHDNPRPGTPHVFDDAVKSYIVALVCSDPPEGFDRWSLDLLQETIVKENKVDSISKETIRIVLSEHDLKPWQQKMWCVPKLDEEYVTRMEDVLEVYEREHDPAFPVICVDEKPVQLTEDARPASGCYPEEVKKVDYGYIRNGTANVFCAVEPKTGVYINQVTEKRTGKDFAEFLTLIEEKYKQAKKIVLIMDNLTTHFFSSIEHYHGEEIGKTFWDRFEIHYTPKHASWLNQAEIAIGMYSRQCLGKTRVPDIEILQKKTEKWNQIINQREVKIRWGFNRIKAREKFDYKYENGKATLIENTNQ